MARSARSRAKRVAKVVFVPHPDDRETIRAGIIEARSGAGWVVDPASFFRWLDTGRGKGPWNDGSV